MSPPILEKPQPKPVGLSVSPVTKFLTLKMPSLNLVFLRWGN
jgi:hypothetical protein